MTDTTTAPRTAAQFLPLTPAMFCATAGVAAWMRDGTNAAQLYAAYQQMRAGNWGDVPHEDAAANDASVIDGSRIIAAYTIDGTRVWIIADAVEHAQDARDFTALFPSEY